MFIRSNNLRLDRLGLQLLDLNGLDHCFSEDEIWAVIRELPDEKAPGPDGFTGLFYKVAWPIIKADIMRVFNAFWSLDIRSLFLLNDAFLVLLKKKPDASELKDYRPISLIHNVSKLITKVLATRLAPKLNTLIGANQSAFIESRCIQDNFQAVAATCKLLNRKKIPTVFLKIDLAKAFDSVAWSFLLELLEFFGFSGRTKVLINGSPGRRICHTRALCQALNGLIRLADSENFFSKLKAPAVSRALLYADDIVLFVAPTLQDLLVLRSLLELFESASSLRTNLAKCSATPIACSLDDLNLVQQTLGCQVTTFPCIYLGIPLNVRRLRRCDEMLIIDKVAARIPRWKGNMLSLAGRSVLVKTTLSAIPVHVAIAVNLSKWAIRAIDKLRRAFLWSGSAISVLGRCKIAWTRVCRPLEFGGLGISDLNLMGIALWVRWCWLQRADPSKVWAGLPCCVEKVVLDLFRASTEVILGDGSTALFWVDSWLDGMAIETIAPNLLKAVPPCFRSRTVKDDLTNRAWVGDIRGTLTELEVVEYVEVWEKLTRFLGANFIWKAKVPPKVKFFACLAAHDRCWTNDRRHRHGLQDSNLCALCDQEVESINHLLLQCSFSREVWFLVFQRLSWETLTPSSCDQFVDWWSRARSRVERQFRKGFDALVLLVACWFGGEKREDF
ncbi:hypothetical protein U9M48_036954 [Paspalum notatum var. saurae]|uniref:Reverse transcriptase domain-containing protein n=1 Tax=Paspalum notatum var. saurae TaxID=547442 RepID=A0AAQ3XBV7_PASNO